MKQEPLKRRRPAARKRGQKQTLQAVVLSVLAVSVIALCLGIWTRLPGEDVPVGGVEPPEEVLSPTSSVVTPSRNLNRSLWWKPSGFPQQEIT